MLDYKKLKAGDKLTLEFTLTSDAIDWGFDSINDSWSTYIHGSEFKADVKEISHIRDMRIGDKVRVPKCNLEHTLLYVHNVDERKFAVVAFEGDIPKSYFYDDVKPV